MPRGQNRLYIVTSKAGETRLIDAANAAQALRYVSAKDYSVTCATSRQVAEVVKKGIEIEEAIEVK